MDSLLSTIENLSNMFHRPMNKFEADLHNNTSPPTNIAGLALVCSMDQLEVQGRRKILLLHGVEEEKKKDLALKAQNIIQT
ncbi:unnamed protein product [Arctia plantaginis]|uniref:Uncharacterized protein n=1 Tax=Arctia plantaginis TaxID=874455 RepID=A0A8S0YUY5_ARCPL|nr:unnamed protein product [Arctia plantaginis]CAB3247715.1 unnamed protein product [Arctia plantaginis]